MTTIAQLYPESMTDVILWPGIMLVVGLAIWYIGLRWEDDLGPGWFKWLAVIPLVIGIYMGFEHFMNIRDPFYQAAIRPGGRMIYSHYAAFILPFLGLITVIVWYYVDRKNRVDLTPVRRRPTRDEDAADDKTKRKSKVVDLD
jgi:hypothetical protein